MLEIFNIQIQRDNVTYWYKYFVNYFRLGSSKRYCKPKVLILHMYFITKKQKYRYMNTCHIHVLFTHVLLI